MECSVCTELLTLTEKAFCMRPHVQTSVLADMQSTGLISTLFNATVTVLTVRWPWMVCIPDRTIDPEEFAVTTAPGTGYEASLRNRHFESQTPHSEEFAVATAPGTTYAEYRAVNIGQLQTLQTAELTNSTAASKAPQ